MKYIYIFPIMLAVLIILWGLLLLTKRKIMVRRVYEVIFVLLIVISFTAKLIDRGYNNGLQSLFLWFFIVFVLIIIINKEQYTIYNVTIEMVESTLINILEEKGLDFTKMNYNLVLTDYDSKQIYYDPSLNNTVEVNFKDIKKLSIYTELKQELERRIKDIELQVFPSRGIISIVIGVGFLGLTLRGIL